MTGRGAAAEDDALGASSQPTESALLEAVRPLLERVAAEIVPLEEAMPGDVVLRWEGQPTLAVRLADGAADPTDPRPEAADLSDGLARLISEVERELGRSLSELPRADKQRAVRLLEERGAFEMRKSAETVAEALGVTRFTVYNYLNRA